MRYIYVVNAEGFVVACIRRASDNSDSETDSKFPNFELVKLKEHRVIYDQCSLSALMDVLRVPDD